MLQFQLKRVTLQIETTLFGALSEGWKTTGKHLFTHYQRSKFIMPRSKLQKLVEENRAKEKTYTAVELAEIVGVTNRTITNWWKRIAKAWDWCESELVVDLTAKRTVWTEQAVEKFTHYQFHCAENIPVIGSGGILETDENGKIVFTPNPNKLSFDQYKDMVQNQFRPAEVQVVTTALAPAKRTTLSAITVAALEESSTEMSLLAEEVEEEVSALDLVGEALGDFVVSRIRPAYVNKVQAGVRGMIEETKKISSMA